MARRSTSSISASTAHCERSSLSTRCFSTVEFRPLTDAIRSNAETTSRGERSACGARSSRPPSRERSTTATAMSPAVRVRFCSSASSTPHTSDAAISTPRAPSPRSPAVDTDERPSGLPLARTAPAASSRGSSLAMSRKTAAKVSTALARWVSFPAL